jgi:hypothetical protein
VILDHCQRPGAMHCPRRHPVDKKSLRSSCSPSPDLQGTTTPFRGRGVAPNCPPHGPQLLNHDPTRNEVKASREVGQIKRCDMTSSLTASSARPVAPVIPAGRHDPTMTAELRSSRPRASTVPTNIAWRCSRGGPRAVTELLSDDNLERDSRIHGESCIDYPARPRTSPGAISQRALAQYINVLQGQLLRLSVCFCSVPQGLGSPGWLGLTLAYD